MPVYTNKIGGLSGEITDPTEGMTGYNSRGQRTVFDGTKWVMPQNYSGTGGTAGGPVITSTGQNTQYTQQGARRLDTSGQPTGPNLSLDQLAAERAAQREANFDPYAPRVKPPASWVYGPNSPLNQGGQPVGTPPMTGGENNAGPSTTQPVGGQPGGQPGGQQQGGKGGQQQGGKGGQQQYNPTMLLPGLGGQPQPQPGAGQQGGKGGQYQQQPPPRGKGGGNPYGPVSGPYGGQQQPSYGSYPAMRPGMGSMPPVYNLMNQINNMPRQNNMGGYRPEYAQGSAIGSQPMLTGFSNPQTGNFISRINQQSPQYGQMYSTYQSNQYPGFNR